jgi:hypothetical protein
MVFIERKKHTERTGACLQSVHRGTVVVHLLTGETSEMGIVVIERSEFKQGAVQLSMYTIRTDVEKFNGVTTGVTSG